MKPEHEIYAGWGVATLSWINLLVINVGHHYQNISDYQQEYGNMVSFSTLGAGLLFSGVTWGVEKYGKSQKSDSSPTEKQPPESTLEKITKE